MIVHFVHRVLVILALASLPSGLLAQEETRTVILFDRSASMLQPHEGTRKIDMAKQLFRQLSATLSDNPNVSVRFFAGGTSGDKPIDCQASESGLAFDDARTTESLAALVDTVKALGHQTPITHALEKARLDMVGWSGPRKIILISDGQETCDEDPEDLAEIFFEDGITIDTVGIGPADVFSQLGMIALAGGGEFQLAENIEGLAGAMNGALPGGVLNFGMQTGEQAGAEPSEAPATAGAGPAVALPLVGEFELPEAEDAPPTVVAVEIIFDASGSMAAQLGGTSKLRLAKDALAAAADGLAGENLHVAFRAYGFDTSLAKTPEASCPNTELLLPFTNTGQAGLVAGQADNLTAYGYTPIARSLQLAGEDLVSIEATQRMIILISDGEETCGGDPAAVAGALREMGIDLQTHVVGFDLDAVAKAQMTEIAREGGGNYYDAGDGAELGDSLIEVIELTQEAADPFDARLIHPVSGGTSIDDAMVLDSGTYTLVDHLPKGEERFFRVETTLAQRGLLRAIVQSRRSLFAEDGTVTESETAYSGFAIRLYRPDGTEVKGHWARVYGDRGEQSHTGYVDLTGEGFFFSVGDKHNPVSKDALFHLEVSDAGDVETGQDAPEKGGSPLAFDANAIVGHLGLEDRQDLLQTAVTGGSTVTLQLVFADPAFRFTVDVRDADTGKRIDRFTKLMGAADVAFDLPDATAAITLLIKDNNPSLDTMFSSYTLEVGQ